MTTTTPQPAEQQTESTGTAWPRFYVVRADPCPACAGSGHVDHALRDQWLAWKKAGRGLEDFHQRFSRGIWPPDLEKPIPCRQCDGTGEVRTDFSLREALAGLGISPAGNSEAA